MWIYNFMTQLIPELYNYIQYMYIIARGIFSVFEQCNLNLCLIYVLFNVISSICLKRIIDYLHDLHFGKSTTTSYFENWSYLNILRCEIVIDIVYKNTKFHRCRMTYFDFSRFDHCAIQCIFDLRL